MKRYLIVASAVALMAVPSFASARDACQQRAHDRKVTGTVLGAVGGALVGGAVGDTKGAVIGGLGGAVVGNQLARKKCDTGQRAYRSNRQTSRQAYNRGPEYRAARTNVSCRYESRPYYDSRGELVYSETRVCN